MVDKTIVCFHNPNEENGYLSNWWMSNFTVEGVKYNCLEQYMMMAKAKLFNDTATGEKIMMSKSPAEMKALGRQVAGFNTKVWDKYKERVVTAGLYAKFSQNHDLKQRLLATGDRVLAECARSDKVWGNGCHMTDERRLDPAKWDGQNLLGKCLMRVRCALREGEKL